jgi:hypothetical protein
MAVLMGLKEFWQGAIARGWVDLGRWLGMLSLVLVLSGCVDSTVGIHFDHASRGEIVQRVQFGERLKNFGGTALEDWSKAVKERASSLGGEVTFTPEQGLIAKIPFISSADLEQKFNQFFGTVLNQESESSSGLSTIAAQLTVDHSNWLVVERDRLVYEIDLRSLGFASAEGEVLVSPASLINLEFQLETPWGAQNYYGEGMNRPRVLQAGHKLIWSLIPGQQNVLETVFWLPSPLGIGTVGIILLVALGFFLKSPQPLREAAAPNSKPA